MGNSQEPKLKVVFLPYIITSHIINLVDTARLFAARGSVSVTIITTPTNARIFEHAVERDIAAFDSRITIIKLKFPTSEVGLPDGLENFSSATNIEIATKLTNGINMLRKPMEQLIHDIRPDGLVTDMHYPWAADLAKELDIPRLVVETNCFFPSILDSLKVHAPHQKVESESESFVVPGLPDKILMKRSELAEHVKKRTPYGDILDNIEESYSRSFGIIFHSFNELEHAYVDHYKQVTGRKCWHIGLPSYLINRVLSSPKKPSSDNNDDRGSEIMKWLDGQKPESVVYVSFGSMVRFPDTQLHEMALALEESGHSFIWVVRQQKDKADDESEEANWMPEGYEERLKGKGLIVRNWAPQVAILSHAATGGFMSHCGWNSSLEAITDGVPLMTWPLFAEQFYNEKLITQVLKIGVEVGSGVWNFGFNVDSPVVLKDKLTKAISHLMGSDGKEIRRRAKEISAVTKTALQEGGQSWSALDSLIKEIENYKYSNGVTL